MREEVEVDGAGVEATHCKGAGWNKATSSRCLEGKPGGLPLP